VPLKVGEIIKMIESEGWYLVATRGSHRQYKQAEPGVATGTERSILKQAGIQRRTQ
jgi:predicted RNA binding protein YcfA (HicA-like mRNA interferase family)